jgi:hypothetical protein
MLLGGWAYRHAGFITLLVQLVFKNTVMGRWFIGFEMLAIFARGKFFYK